MLSRAPKPLVAPKGTVPEGELRPEDVRRVANWVRRLAGPHADADDLVQEVLIAAWRGRDSFRGDAKLSTWLFRITEKVVLKRRRTEGRFRKWLFRSQQEPQPPVRGPAEELERREKVLLLYQALDRLSPPYRTTLILFELEGMATEEIGELLGCTTNNVRVRLHRARASLFAELAALQSNGKGDT